MESYYDILIRLVAAALVGGIIGLEREMLHKPAGIRTHMLVALGSAVFATMTLEIAPVEIARVVAGVITGIGFLGAGTIFKSKDDVHGLTSAASIWVVAGIGLCVGLGLYFLSTIATILALIILHIVKIGPFRNQD